jgi:hypothetical protein
MIMIVLIVLRMYYVALQAVVLSESLVRRLPGCTALASALMHSTLYGSTDWEQGRTVYRPSAWVDGPVGRTAVAALMAGRHPYSVMGSITSAVNTTGSCAGGRTASATECSLWVGGASGVTGWAPPSAAAAAAAAGTGAGTGAVPACPADTLTGAAIAASGTVSAAQASRQYGQCLQDACTGWPEACQREWALSVLDGTMLSKQNLYHSAGLSGRYHDANASTSSRGAALRANASRYSDHDDGCDDGEGDACCCVEHRMYVYAAEGEMRLATTLWQV